MTKRMLDDGSRTTLERFRVIDRPAVPRLDKLEEAVKERRWGLSLTGNGKGLTTAQIEAGGETYRAESDRADEALTRALCAALVGTEDGEEDA